MAAGSFLMEDSISGKRLSGTPRQINLVSTAPGGATGIATALGATSDFFEVVHGVVTLVSSATVGNRTVYIAFEDNAGRELFAVESGVNVAAGLTSKFVLADAVPRGAGGQLLNYCPIACRLLLPSTGFIRVKDGANIDAAGDRFSFAIMGVDFNFLVA